mgnify:CR=1 FL=1
MKQKADSIGDLFEGTPHGVGLSKKRPQHLQPNLITRVNELELSIAEEAKLKGMDIPLLIGVDEAGRGPWAGPVVASAVILPVGFGVFIDPNPLYDHLLSCLNDSKKLSEKKRLALVKPICQSALGVGVGIASPQQIDELNIAQANYSAMRTAVKKSLKSLSRSRSLEMECYQLVLIDGLHIIPSLALPQRAIVKGDQRSYHIAAASIIAKVVRDKIMIAADRRYPKYGFAQHKGYGTKAHQEALKLYGPCPLHRKTYKPIRALLMADEKKQPSKT